MPGHSRPKDGVASLAYVPGTHVLAARKTWMAGTSPAMTAFRLFDYNPATFGSTSFENSRSERSAASTAMLPGVKCSDTLSMPPTLSL